MPLRLHRDQQGTMSIVSVFAVFMLVFLLGMVMNVGRDVDAKIRLQNTADSVALSGGTVIARGLNVLAFSNHLLFDVFALTAFHREAQSVYDAQRYVPEILAAWNGLQPVFARSGFPKFERLAPAIVRKTPLEQRLVDVYAAWLGATSTLTLPLLEDILRNEMIPEFQRAVVEAYPDIAQAAAMRVAERNAPPGSTYGRTLGVLWRTNAQPVGFAEEVLSRTMPVVDPQMDLISEQPEYLRLARAQREWFVKDRYLGIAPRRGTRFYPTWRYHAPTWTDEAFWMFDNAAKMSQFGNLFRDFACGQLDRLFNAEYPMSNLPFVIRASNNPDDGPELPHLDPSFNNNAHLNQHHTLIGVAYRHPVRQTLPQYFRNPMRPSRALEPYSAVAYATVRVFIPKARLVWTLDCPPPPFDNPAGGVPGEIPPLPPPEDDPPPDPEEPLPGLPGAGHRHEVVRQGSWRGEWPRIPGGPKEREWELWEHWGLTNQHWTVQLVPSLLVDTAQPVLATILQQDPGLPEFSEERIVLPNLGNLSDDDIGWISPH